MEHYDEGEDAMTGSGTVQVPTAGGNDVLVEIARLERDAGSVFF